MKSLDNTIKYYELLMFYEDTSIYEKHLLPEGFHFEFYKNGDMNDWINIILKVENFVLLKKE